MVPLPSVVGLVLSEQVIVDQRSRNPTIVNVFTGLKVEHFSSAPQRFSVFAALSGGRGVGTMDLVGMRLDTGLRFYAQRFRINFPDPLIIVNVNIRVRNMNIPEAGWYELMLLIDDEPIAQRRFRVYEG
jgi:hypothetical protein